MKKLLNYAFIAILSFSLLACSNSKDEPKKPDGPNTENPDNPNTGGEVKPGEGTKASPYSVAGATANQSGSAWVTAYVVGYIDTSGENNVYKFDATNCEQETNLLIADAADVKDENKVMSVQLPSGVIREKLNLKANPNVLGTKVVLYGDLTSYFKKPGVKGVSYAVLADGTKVGQEPIDQSQTSFYYSFTEGEGLGDFTTYSVTGEEEWYYNSTYKCAYITGYVSETKENKENEDWLISPTIDLTGKSNAVLTFSHVVRYTNNIAGAVTVWASEDYQSGNPSSASWKQVDTNFTDGTSWSFVNTGNISLSALANKKVKIALKYVATTEKAGTWEVKDFAIK